MGKWLMGKWKGKMLYPWVLFSQPKEDVSDRLFRHELEHVYQVWDMGWLWFNLKYMLLLIRYGYAKHPFELQAHEAQDKPLTIKERKMKNA